MEYRQVIQLLESDALRSVEEPIAAAHRLKILADNSTVRVNRTTAELSVCGMTINEIKDCLLTNREAIIELALQIKNKGTDDREEYPEGEEEEEGDNQSGTVLGMSRGFGLLFAIYYDFLSRRTGKEFRAFLKNRRIPRHTKYAKELEVLFGELQSRDKS